MGFRIITISLAQLGINTVVNRTENNILPDKRELNSSVVVSASIILE